MQPEDTIEVSTHTMIAPLSEDHTRRIPSEAQKTVQTLLSRLALRALRGSLAGSLTSTGLNE
jgi:hypothetical protein